MKISSDFYLAAASSFPVNVLIKPKKTLIFFVQSRVTNFQKRLDKKFKKVDKEKLSVPETRQFSFGQPKKMRNLPDNGLAKETDQNHMDVPRASSGI